MTKMNAMQERRVDWHDCKACGMKVPRRMTFCNMACRKAFQAKFRDEMRVLTAEKLRRIMTYDAISGRLVRKAVWPLKRGAGSIDSSGYRQLRVSTRQYLEHRLVWLYHFGEWPSDEIDHINHDRLDNRIENLRVVCRSENAKNLPARPTRSGMLGVRQKKTGRWEARIGVGNSLIHLGTFDTADEAISARRIAERKMGFHNNHGQHMERS